jgi:hypothetical protein
MRKFLLGAVAVAAIASPLALAASAEAAPVLSTDANCAPILPAPAVKQVDHVEYKYQPATGSGHIQWDRTAGRTDLSVNGVKYVASLNGKGVQVSQIVIDSPAVPEVVGVTCVIPLPANPLNVTLARPADTDKYTWSAVTDHSFGTLVNNGNVGIKVTAKPGYVFAYGSSTLASKAFTLNGVIKSTYTDIVFGDVTCHEVKTSATTEDVYCVFKTPRPDLAGTEGNYAWQSDFDLSSLGLLAYKVNADGTGYRATVTY